MAQKHPYTLIIVDDNTLGPVALTVYSHADEIHVHLPHPIENFPPFGANRCPNKGRLLHWYFNMENKNPKKGQWIRIKNVWSGETSEPLQVLAVYHNNQIEMTVTATTTIKNFTKEIMEIWHIS